MSTSIMAARSGYGYAWLPEEKIREELANGTLAPLPLREGRERYAQLYLVLGSRETAGPGVLRLAALIAKTVKETCNGSTEREAAPRTRRGGRARQAGR
jgi:DNA-binding transcriptional LysR family regulator